MRTPKFKFTPIAKPFLTAVSWQLHIDDYNKIKAGNDRTKGPWRCFMDHEIIHILKGYNNSIEHYRFVLHKGVHNTFSIKCIESLRPLIEVDTYAEFLEDASSKHDHHKSVKRDSPAEEVKSLLTYFFDIIL